MARSARARDRHSFRQHWLRDDTGPRDALQADTVSREIDELGHARFQSTRAKREEDQKTNIRDKAPELSVGGIELVVNEERHDDEIDDHGGGNEAVPERHA